MRNCKVCGNPKTLYGSELRCAKCRREAERKRYADEGEDPAKVEARKKARRDWYQANKKAQGARSKKWRLENPLETLVASAKGRAKALGIPFDLTAEDLSIPAVCPVLGIPLVRGVGQTQPGSPSLDRIIPVLGYVAENVRVISYRANVLKSDASIEELEAVLRDARFVRRKE